MIHLIAIMVNVDLFYAFLTVVNLVNCWKKTIKMNFIHVKMAIIAKNKRHLPFFILRLCSEHMVVGS